MFSLEEPINKVIDKLKDDKNYYGDYGKQYLSNSNIRSLINSPNEFKKPTKPAKELIMGSYFHTAMLEPDKSSEYKIIESSTRSTKVFKDYIKENNLDAYDVLLTKETEQVMTWVDKMSSNIEMYEYIYDSNNKFEVPGVAQIMGNWWKGKADIITEDYVIDLKTTTKIHDFKWKCNNFYYNSQAYLYQRIFGKKMIFFIIDKDTLQLKISDCSPEFIERGKENVEKATNEYNKFYGAKATQDPENFILKETL